MARYYRDYDQHVQFSVIKCDVYTALWAKLRAPLIRAIYSSTASLRFYMIGQEWRSRIKHVDAKPAKYVDERLII